MDFLVKRIFILGYIGLLPVQVFAVYNPDDKDVPQMSLKSSAFEHRADIPEKYTCQDEDISPPLEWSGHPEATVSFAIICLDPDAPGKLNPWVHWVIFNIPGNQTSLQKHVPRIEQWQKGIMQGKNSFQSDSIGYRGPCPPPGAPHRYIFTIYALDATLNVQGGITKEQLLTAMQGHVLACGELIGMYQAKAVSPAFK